MKTLKTFIAENHELELYRQHTLRVVNNHIDDWKHTVEQHLNTKVHRAHAHGSVTDKSKFKESSDIDVIFHTVDKNKPKGPDAAASEGLSGKLFHPDLGHVDVAIMNHHDKSTIT